MLKLEKVTRIFKGPNHTKVKALDNINLRFPDNGFVFIIGKSGSGKSTLLNAIGGLDKISKGKIFVNNLQLNKYGTGRMNKYRHTKIGFIFQHYYLIEHLTIEQNIELSLDITRDNKYSVEELLDLVGLKDFKKRYPKELSGGQRQRIAIARALAKNPDIILADEPTGNLDKLTSKVVLDILKEISKKKLIILVSHNLLEATQYADRIIELRDGKVLNDVIKCNDLKYEYYTKGKTIYLPFYRDLTKDETKDFLKRLNDPNITRIVQQDDGFKPFDQTNVLDSDKKVKLKSKNLSFKNICKYIKLYLIKLKFNSLFIVFITVLLLLGISVISSLEDKTYLDTNYDESLKYVKYTKGDLNVASSVFNTYLEPILEEEIKEIENVDYNGKIYKLYPYTFFNTSNQGNTTSKLTSEIMQNCIKFYIQESLGTLNCDESFLRENLTKNKTLEILAGKLDNSFDSIIITDYVADSLIYFYPDKYRSYDDIIGPFLFLSKKINIAAVVKTDYKEKYQSLIDKYKNCSTTEQYNLLKDQLKSNELYQSFLKDVLMYYGINYSLADDFKDYYHYFYSNNMLIRKVEFEIDGNNGSSNSISLYPKSTLKDNEIEMSYLTYNKLFNTKLTSDNYLEYSNKPMKLKFFSTPKGSTILDENTYIVKLQKTSNFYVSSNKYEELVALYSNPVSIYLENNGKIDNVHEKMQDKFYFTNIDTENVMAVNTMISIINPFFGLIKAVLYVVLLIFIILFGYNIIKKNIFDIGVMLSFGMKHNDIVKIFITNIIFNALLICVIASIFYPILIVVADVILTGAFETMLSIHIYTFNIVEIRMTQLFYNILIILTLSLFSAVLNMFRVALMKPINLINSENKEV